MDVREKLVELLQDGDNPVWGWFPNNATMIQLADYLIAHGVTVQEDCKDCAESTKNCIVKLQEQISDLRSVQRWIPVTERLPEKPTKCLVYTKRGEYGGYEITYYNEGFYLQYSKVTHWMPLPKPPKGE